MNLFIAVISNVHLYVGLSYGSRKQDLKNAPKPYCIVEHDEKQILYINF